MPSLSAAAAAAGVFALLLCQRKIHRGQGQENEWVPALAEELAEHVVWQARGL